MTQPQQSSLPAPAAPTAASETAARGNLAATAAIATRPLASVSSQVLAQLERRLALFRRMSESLLRSRNAIVSRNLDGLLEATAEQQSLCTELRRLLGSSISARPSLSGMAGGHASAVQSFSVAPDDLASAADLSRQLAEAQRELRFAARVNDMLLQRSRGTVASLRNLYMSYSGTYEISRPASPAGANRG